MKFLSKYKLEIVVFLCGAIGMGLEIVAARVLSPYVGSSNIVWTSIIGIILVSMSLGYWIGGKKADQGATLEDISNVIFIAALSTSLIPILETIMVREIAMYVKNLTIAAMICAIVLFSMPSLILAMISPLAVKIKSEEEKRIGIVSGKISSLSTIGSILGTFISGFVLIPNIGVRNINIGITTILILLPIILVDKIDKKFVKKMVILIAICVPLMFLGKFLFNIANPEIILDKDSQYSRIWIKNIKVDDKEYKAMQVDRGLESHIDESTGKMGAKYLEYYDLFEYLNKDAKDTLMIGGAAYTYPIHYLNKYTDKTIDVVEIDPQMTKIAISEFGLDINNPQIRIFHQDGRSFINYNNNKYDTILLDAFKGLNAPFELTTYEAMMNAKNMLNENGMIITNIISSLEGKDSKFIEYEYTTYKEVFDDVLLYKVKNKENTKVQNIILIGIKGNPIKNENKRSEYQKYLDMEVKDYNSKKKIVTDDFAPIGN